MSSPTAATPIVPPHDAPAAAPSATCVFLFTDLVGSTAWKQRLGDRVYANELRRPHDRLFRELLATFPGAVERDNAGDGFLATFANPSDAVLFALRLHRALADFPWADAVRATGELPSTRVGIHLGEVVEYADGGVTRVTGQAVDLAARVMGLAAGGQTLLTRHASDSARQHVRGGDLAPGASISWPCHGRYRLKGHDAEPLEVFEAGEEGRAPLSPPPDTDKAKRVLVDPEDETGSWRPAAGLAVPRRDGWVIEAKLGEGGFGEVWLARHKRTKEARVFKFCFDAERLRSFKRELTFFKLIQSELGSRPDFARLYDVQVEKPPYFLESEYVEEGNLAQWVEKRRQGGRGGVFDAPVPDPNRGVEDSAPATQNHSQVKPGHSGLTTWPLAGRLKFLAGVARAVAAAHSLGIIHKDLKPSNVFVTEEGGEPRPMLADFGIGILADRTLLRGADITETGFTESVMLGNDSSRTGTRLYSPPEAQLGKPATTGTDVYALGVMLFQLVVGDLKRPMGTGWQEAVDAGDAEVTALLLEDITAATRADPSRRLASAAELAQRLERLDERAAERRKQAARARQSRRLRVMQRLLGAALVGLGVVGGLAIYAWQQRSAAIKALDEKGKALAAETKALNEKDKALTAETKALKEKDQALGAEKKARAAERQARDTALAALRDMTDDIVQNQMARAPTLTEENKEFLRRIIRHFEGLASLNADDADSRAIRAEGLFSVGIMRHRLGELEEAKDAYSEALAIQRRLVAAFPTQAEFRQKLAASQTNLGNVLSATGRPMKAEEAFRDALAIQKQLAADFPARFWFHRDLALSHNNLGNLLSETNRLKQAEDAYGEALAIRKRLVATFPDDPEFEQDLAMSHNNLGVLLRDTGGLQRAEAAYRDALDIFKRLATDFPERPEFRHGLALSHNNLGDLLRVTGRPKEAERAFRDGLAIQKQLAVDFPARPEFRQELARSHNSLGILFSATNRLKQAEAACSDALAFREQLAADFPDQPDRRNDVAGSHLNLAILCNVRCNFKAARAWLDEGRPHHRAALKANPRHPYYRQSYRNNLLVSTEATAGLLDQAGAVKSAETIRDLGWDKPSDAYDAACALALCIPIVSKHQQLDAEKRKAAVQFYGDQALAMLRDAVAKGYRDAAHMKKDTDLDPLRHRDDFKKLLADLEAKAKEPDAMPAVPKK